MHELVRLPWQIWLMAGERGGEGGRVQGGVALQHCNYYWHASKLPSFLPVCFHKVEVHKILEFHTQFEDQQKLRPTNFLSDIDEVELGKSYICIYIYRNITYGSTNRLSKLQYQVRLINKFSLKMQKLDQYVLLFFCIWFQVFSPKYI